MKVKRSALDEIMQEEEEKKKKMKIENQSNKSDKNKDELIKDYWLKRNIVVKVVTKSLGDKYYKQKGYVSEVIDKYAGIIVMLGSNVNGKVKLDQDHLETVIPAEGKSVLVVNGKYRGEEGTLVSLDIDKFCAKVKLKEDGKITTLPYEHFSKLYTR